METRNNYGLNQSDYFDDSHYTGVENSQIHTPGNYSSSAISNSSYVQQPQKCIILKPVTSNSNSKAVDLKYTIIRSFTPPKRAFYNVPMKSSNYEADLIAQKIPISLPKLIADVANPRNDFNSSTNNLSSNFDTDRSTVFPVNQFPPHVRNVIGGLTSSRRANNDIPLLIDASQFLNNAGTQHNVDSNYQIYSTTQQQNAVTWPGSTNVWKNENFCQPFRSNDNFNNMEDMMSDHPANVPLQKHQNMGVLPDWESNEFTTATTNGGFSNAEHQKSSDFGDWPTNVDWKFDNFEGSWGNAETLPIPTNTLNNNSQLNLTPQKSNKVIPTITGTKIIPNVFNPHKIANSNSSLGYVNGQNPLGSFILNSTVPGSTGADKTIFTNTIPRSACNDKEYLEKSKINSSNSSLSSNMCHIGNYNNYKNKIFTTPSTCNDNSQIILCKQENVIHSSTQGMNMKIHKGLASRKIMSSSAFDNSKFMNKSNIMDYAAVNSNNIVDNINSRNILTAPESNLGFLEKPNIINSSTLYPKVVGNAESGKISTFNNVGFMGKSMTINKAGSNIAKSMNKYSMITTSTVFGPGERILPVNSDEEELLDTPDSALDNSFNIELSNECSTVMDVFRALNNDSKFSSIKNNVSQAGPTLDLSDSFSVLLENKSLVKEENKNVQESNDEKYMETSGIRDSILPNYQEVPEDLSFGFMEDQTKFPITNSTDCEENDQSFDLDSLIDKSHEFHIEAANKAEIVIGKEGREGGIDGEESCKKIIKEESGDDVSKTGKETKDVDSDKLLSLKVGGEEDDSAQVLLPCGLCEMMFQDKQSLKVHLKTHSKENDFVCEVCGRSFKQETTLKNHYMRSHTFGEKKYKCNVCEQSFALWSMLKIHRESVHPSQDKHQCYICEKVFPNKTALKAHVQRHTDPRRYKCQYCGKVYKDRAGLNVHLVVHTQVSKFSCSLCDRKFGKKNLLTDHMKIFHLKQKDHTCHECNRAFSTKNTLKRHSWIHTGEKNYICEICGRPFRQKVALTVHMKVHNKPPKTQSDSYGFAGGNGLVNLCNNKNFVSYPECSVLKFEDDSSDSKYNNLVMM